MKSVTVVTVVERRPIIPPPSRPPLWMHLEDKDIRGFIRSCAPCPAVWVLKDDPHAEMDEQWQYYLRAINHHMTLEHVYLLLDDHLAFANRTGFPTLGNPGGRADYFFRRNLGAKPPNLDKVRTGSRSVMTGTETYRLMQAFRDVIAVAKQARAKALIGSKRQAFMQAATAPNMLRVQVFDSRKPPPLKSGRVYPQDISEVNPDDYLYMPERNRERFFAANIVNRAGGVVQFPRGALYPWFLGGKTTVSWMPHIANLGFGNVLYSLRNLRKLSAGEPIPSPYRSA